MRQLRRWKRLRRKSLTCSHKRTFIRPFKSCWNSTTRALQPEEITWKRTVSNCPRFYTLEALVPRIWGTISSRVVAIGITVFLMIVLIVFWWGLNIVSFFFRYFDFYFLVSWEDKIHYTTRSLFLLYFLLFLNYHLVCWSGRDLFVSQNQRKVYVTLSPGQILVCLCSLW